MRGRLLVQHFDSLIWCFVMVVFFDEKEPKESKSIRKELIELPFLQPYSKIVFVVIKSGVERQVVSRYLKELEEIGIVESQKDGRETFT